MQQEIDKIVNLGQIVSPFDSIGKSLAIDRTASEFDNANEKLKKIKRLIYSGKYDVDIACYIPRMSQLMFQGMLDRVDMIDQPAHFSYKDLETFNFQLLLDQNLCTNLNISVPHQI